MLSHGDVSHAGALAALAARGVLPVSLPIISTSPAKAIARLSLLELLNDKKARAHRVFCSHLRGGVWGGYHVNRVMWRATLQACSDFDAYTRAHVEHVCARKLWTSARFYQRITLHGA